MEFLIENWYIILAILAVLALAVFIVKIGRAHV